ncbi:glycosyltransferase family 2 protein [Thecamonas trahens ATCC 50062]|uniref:Glycosyltransferase family 2 protein n=1 Tax=Thecamonas trahens ATCC 50062 TaxID=461836 RepID=A0A0L0D8N2_THETB|nr:glycosyltransferase family 2 protein [Thecamonas trahens ATCC 50062]KNC47648.1 glycosyltransferase family 2 protein [Thecamonas trahens ATCC 50062]|eukprot:XP_013759132.1 glycosyltransferase family 2 protein [Thecamonas trahens ATCC 50062]
MSKGEGGSSMHGVLVSVLIPCKNTGELLKPCLASIAESSHRPLEVCLYDDGSDDDGVTLGIIAEYASNAPQGISVVIGSRSQSDDGAPSIGAARNAVAALASGDFLCWLDSDDVMLPCRIAGSLETYFAKRAESGCDHVLVGSRFVRDPPGSTPRYAAWANSLSQDQLVTHRFRECTLIQPTWFLPRASFAWIGGYEAAGLAEDFKFLLTWVCRGGVLARLDAVALVYTYSAGSLSWKVPQALLRKIRVEAFEQQVLGIGGEAGAARPATLPAQPWAAFAIWGAGKDAKAFFRALSDEAKARVTCFADIDPAKLSVGTYPDTVLVPVVVPAHKMSSARKARKAARKAAAAAAAAGNPLPSKKPRALDGQAAHGQRSNGDGSGVDDDGPITVCIKMKRQLRREIPIVAVADLRPPFVAAVALDRTQGTFEAALAASGYVDGVDYFHVV